MQDVVFGSVIAWDWGDAGPWLVLILALVVAVAIVAGRLDDRSSLASHVYVVVSKSTASDDRPGEAAGHVSVRPANYGEAPIFGLAIALHSFGHRRRSWRFQQRDQWWTGAPVPGGVRTYPMIEPDSSGQTVELPVPEEPSEGLPPRRDPQVILTFRDSNGRRWVRWPNGKLQSASLTRRWKAHRAASRPSDV
jgi:hypothetical protein